MRLATVMLVTASFCFLCAGMSFAQEMKSIGEYTFDGFKLGDNYAEKVMSRAPYDKPCDNDPIDDKARRFMVYGGLPCRDLTFPNKTTVVFYLRYSDTDKYAQPIEAFAFLGGDYFSDKTDHFITIGDKADETMTRFGVLIRTFEIKRKDLTLGVHQSAGNVYALFKDNIVVGVVIGPMPKDPENEQWRGLMQMYQRYTPKN